MKFVLALTAFVAMIAAVYSQGGTMSACQICCHIVGHAEHHFHKQTPENQLLHELTRECLRLGHQNQQDGQVCLQQVHKFIDTIYKDFEAGSTTVKVCTDMGDCTSTDVCVAPAFPTGAPPS
uniref:Saposin B-type domain-containing protein n=1 Tax=Parastrongyloides trichosuri TaxID=131310 RepID=A0A0N4ZGZ6_PARTI